MDFGLVFDKFTERFRSIMYGYDVYRKNYRPLEIDPITWGLHTIDTEHHEIHEGSHYFISDYVDLAINRVLDVTLKTPDNDRWLHLTWRIDVENETNWLVYEDATQVTPLVDTILPLNNNRNSRRQSGAVFRYENQASIEAANTDTSIVGAYLLEQGIAGAKQSAGDSQRTHELILKQNTLYCFRAIATVAGWIDFNMHWYEHRPFGH